MLVTSKNAAALDVIKSKIKDCFEETEKGDDVKKLIMSWGNKEQPFKALEEAADALQGLEKIHKPDGHGQEMDKMKAQTKKLSGQITQHESYFRNGSIFAFKSLREIAVVDVSRMDASIEPLMEKLETLKDMAYVISGMSSSMEDDEDRCGKIPRELANFIKEEEEDCNDEVTSRFEEDLQEALNDKQKHKILSQFFKSASRICDPITDRKVREYCKSQKSEGGRDPMIPGVQEEGAKSQSLHEIARDHKTIQDRKLAETISEMCEVDGALREFREKETPEQLDEFVSEQLKEPNAIFFRSWVEDDLKKTHGCEIKRSEMLRWFKSSRTLREDVNRLRKWVENACLFMKTTGAEQDVANSYIERSDQQTSVASWFWVFAHEQQP